MPEPKKFHEDPKKIEVDSEKIYVASTEIERKAHYIASCCLFYDITPGGSHDATENFVEFLKLLLVCSEKKLYSVRDGALKRIVEILTE